jgi:hypothetical protein
MGWSRWNHFRANIDEKMIRSRLMPLFLQVCIRQGLVALILRTTILMSEMPIRSCFPMQIFLVKALKKGKNFLVFEARNIGSKAKLEDMGFVRNVERLH